MNRYPLPVGCLIRDLSLNGARIVLTEERTISEEFNLTLSPSGQCYDSRVVWATAVEVGVTFSEMRTGAPEVLLG